MTEIRHFPAAEPRVETGVVRFGDDWPGLFIRGDNALFFAQVLERTIELADAPALDNPLTLAPLKGLLDDLRSVSVGDTGWPPKL